MKRVFYFGKIAYSHPRIRRNLVEVSVELRKRGGEKTFMLDKQTGLRVITGKTPEYHELSICGSIWNGRKSDIVCGGQCLDTIAEYRSQLTNANLFDQLYLLWKNWHLNGMHAGTPEQEAAIDKWKQEGHKYDYAEVCEFLKSIGLYEVNYTGITVGRRYENEPYKYGHGWVVKELPSDIYDTVIKLLS